MNTLNSCMIMSFFFCPFSVILTVKSFVNLLPVPENSAIGDRICNRASLNMSNDFLSGKKEQAEDTSRHAPRVMLI